MWLLLFFGGILSLVLVYMLSSLLYRSVSAISGMIPIQKADINKSEDAEEETSVADNPQMITVVE